ncbi:hypothetical protein [Vaginisenegalia massiliensis]|uniref:hypothetical protein n=1 Tax=Vaginisenegalia massiliensis TaxID=2058294 RepID=UPI000F54A136|nr:hypothetical protein [Vaginisenegalia massiliensis]
MNEHTKAVSGQQEILIQYMLQDQDYLALNQYLEQIGLANDASAKAYVSLAQAILAVDLKTVAQLAPRLNYDYLLQGSDLEQATYAYFLYLSVQLKRHEYMDYLRGLTPILVNVFRLLIEHDFMPNLADYMEPIHKESDHGDNLYRGIQWSRSKVMAKPNRIQSTWHHYYGDSFDYEQYVSSSHLLKLIESYSKHPDLVAKAQQMRQVEKLVRNMVAHEVVYVNPEWIEARCHLSPMQIHELLLELMTLAGLDKKPHLQVLSQLNHDILTALKLIKQEN